MSLTYNGTNIQSIKYNNTSLTKLIYNGTTIWESENATELCFTANTAGSTVELIKVGSPSITNTAYSTDRVTWTSFSPSTTVGTNVVTLANAGDKVYFRNSITSDILSASNYLQFKMTGSISASGNCNSIYSATNFANLTTLTYINCFINLFKDCSVLTSMPRLPATTVSIACYNSMFSGCTALASITALPATTLATTCYASMFKNCTALTIAPVLPATTLAEQCYWCMFYGCTALTNAPSLPATTAVSDCYGSMFYNCTSLTTPPELPATTLDTACYYSMFKNCTALTAIPVLTATTLKSNCYSYMFQGCTSLQVSDSQTTAATHAWSIPASGTFTNTTTYTQEGMFANCTGTRSLDNMPGVSGQAYTYYTQNAPVGQFKGLCFTANTAGSTVELIKVGDPSIVNTAYSRDGLTWYSYTPSTTAGTNVITLTNAGDVVYFRNDITGNFLYNRYLQFKLTGNINASGNCNSMYSATGFANLTTLTYDYCFGNLFNGCTALRTAPELPATTLADFCYYFMFSGCSSLLSAPTLPATNLVIYCYNNMFSNCNSLATVPAFTINSVESGCCYAMFYGCAISTTNITFVATTLADSCFGMMFTNCTRLTTAPKLPATTLANNCYYLMFRGCTSLYVSDTRLATVNYTWNIPESGTFTNTTTYNQSNMFYDCLGTRSSNDMSGSQGESHTYYTQNQPI